MRIATADLAAPPPLLAQWPIVVLGAGTLVLGYLWLGALLAMGALLAIGALLGMRLYHGALFTAAYRGAIQERDVSGAIAQLLMVGAAMLLFLPLLASGHRTGAVAPASLQVAIGSFLFGLGMQLGGGCGSGTLYTAGGGNVRMLVTLAAFCAGAFWVSLDMARYAGLPSLGSVVPARIRVAGCARAAARDLRGTLGGAHAFRGRRGAAAAAVARAHLARRALVVGLAAVVQRPDAGGAQLADPAGRRPSVERDLGVHPVGR